ncbi:nitrobenzene nitroreductase [Sphingopyxis fribergensis]|uniref:Nitrobenzene nitroreductase n=1 Tax=Sphingopyxis fribergensis TaxID=1515612 RepID=A0A0A7PHR4_9SPHN|nr:nitroreductase [Sphingopyxis fribergensis]AJA09524.1 nitrobenzene nitroreductase [Sphingopyxis fribergensis]
MIAEVRHDEWSSDQVDFVDRAIASRRTKRGYLDRPVDLNTLRDILAVAAWSPSSSNTQPWRTYVLTGTARERLSRAAVARWREEGDDLFPEYPYFPPELHEPFLSRRHDFGGTLGDAYGVAREDKVGRDRYLERQFQFFGAPIGMIFTMDRRLAYASFICYGTFLQSIMIAARARGLDTCAQQIWSLMHPLLQVELGLPEHEMVVAGMSLGWADDRQPQNQIQLAKLDVDDFAIFRDS